MFWKDAIFEIKLLKVMLFKMFLLKYMTQIEKKANVHKQKAAHFLIITADQRTSW